MALSRSQTVDESVGIIELKASMSRASGRDVQVPISFAGSAVAGQDYLLSPGASITIPAGQLIGTLAIPLVDDFLAENAETVTFQLLPSSDAELSSDPAQPLTHTVIIPQNDAPSAYFPLALRTISESARRFRSSCGCRRSP